LTPLTFAVRNLAKNRVYTGITISGLTLSLVALILMSLYIEDELRFDQFHQKRDRIFRVADDKQTADALLHNATSSAPVAPALLAEFPQVESAVRLIPTESLVGVDGRYFQERKVFYADESLFSIFSFDVLKGDQRNALKNPSTVAVTSRMAAKYFGEADPIGKSITMDGKVMKITAMLKNVPAHSQIDFDILISMSTAMQPGTGYDWLFTNWYSDQFYTYVLLSDHADANRLAGQLAAFDLRHREKEGKTVHHYALEKLSAIYLHSDRLNQVGKTGSLSNLYILSAVAFFILLLACINFVNLSTARSVERAKEVAVKKINGASGVQLALQFIAESGVMTIMSMLIAVGISYLLIPGFNSFTGKEVGSLFFSVVNISILLAVIFFITLIAGAYPVLMMLRFKPALALKGKITVSGGSVNLRKALVVFQFAVSSVLLVCSIVVYRQLNFMQHHSLGFDVAQTLVINYDGDNAVNGHYGSLRRELLTIPGVKSVTASSSVPGVGHIGGWSMNFVKQNGDTIGTELPLCNIDFNFLTQYNISVISGRTFSPVISSDSTESMLINEAAVKTLGFAAPDDALGVVVEMYPTPAKVIGVVKDFNFESLQQSIRPLALRVLSSNFRFLSIRINPGNITNTISAVSARWTKMFPGRPVEMNFLDDSFNRQYNADIKFGQVFNVFTVLAIVIACMGLFGVCLFSVQRRVREIAIRKILGASSAGLTYLLSADFLKLVFIAILISIPASILFMQNWLQHFAFRISLNGWMFLIACLTGMGVALITIGFHTLRVALANPVNTLRSE
jgi:putative ABC transport system permease protein